MKTREDFGQHPPLRIVKRYGDILSRMKLLFEELSLTQKDVSEKLGISQSYLSQILNGKKPLTIEHIIAIAETYNVNLNWFILGKKGEILLDSEDITAEEKEKILEEIKNKHSDIVDLLEKLE